VNPSVSTTYTVTIISEEGCEYVRFVPVIVKTFTEIFVPNAFSPNGDGNNDFFVYIARGIFKLESFKVFSRWGEMVFRTDVPEIGWSGTFNGQPMSVGAYVYEIRGSDSENQSIVFKDNFTLIR
jgi:gliding motility-associated-like protein